MLAITLWGPPRETKGFEFQFNGRYIDKIGKMRCGEVHFLPAVKPTGHRTVRVVVVVVIVGGGLL